MTKGVHHLGLTVEDLDEAVGFFVGLLGWKEVRRDSEYPSVFVSDGTILLTLWKAQIKEPLAHDRKKNLGLHHFALLVESKEELLKMYEVIKSSKFEIEFSPEPLRGGPTEHFIFYGPSKIRMEFINVEKGEKK